MAQMTFFALRVKGVDQDRVDLLKKACSQKKIRFLEIDPAGFDVSGSIPAKKGDIVYRVGKGDNLRRLERYFLKAGATTCYSDLAVGPLHRFNYSLNKISEPSTFYCMTRDRGLLKAMVKKVGGFPVVIKVPGGSRGLGVIKIDSFPSLFSVVDYLLTQNPFVVMRQFIDVKTSIRCIVLGDDVIAVLEYKSKHDDFRTNEAASPDVRSKKIPEFVKKLAIGAAKARGLEFAGVDILVKGKKAYVTEANFPLNFARVYEATGKNVAVNLVKYLVNKSARS